MEIKVYNNVFDNEYKTFEYDTSKPLLKQLEEHIEKETYRETLVECYDPETGETFYAPMLDEEIENPSVMIVVDGKSVDKDYQPKEGELVSVVFLPTSERAGNIAAGAIIGAGVGITLAGLLLMPFAGGMFASAAMAMAPQLFGLLGLSGAVIGGFAGNSYYNNHGGKTNGTIDSGKQGTQSPDVRGAENSSIRGENFSFVIGKHLVAPRIIGDPITEYSGPRGEDAYIRTLYQVGYAPLKLTEFKLGEFMLAYNRDHKLGDGTTVECGTYVAGRLKGFSRGNVPDSGDILDYWKNNDVELEIIQQPNQAGEWVTIDDEYQNNTVIDLEDRPQVSSSTMTAAGWTVESGKTYTLFPQRYSTPDGMKTVLVTPINQDGTVLTPTQLEDIADDCLIPSETVVATVKFNITNSPAPYKDPYLVNLLKISLNAVISSSVEIQVYLNNAWVSVLTLPSGAVSSQLQDTPRWSGTTCRIKIGSWTSSSFVAINSGTETINTPETYQAPEHPENLVATFNGSDSADKAAEYAVGIVANLDAYYNDEKYSDGVNYGNIYTSTYDDQQINANLFYIADKELDENAKVVYKGSEFPNKFRTNGVFFTAACPMEFTITLDFQNGLYDTYTKTEDNTTTTHYDAIPLYLCVQWRIYSSTNKSSDPTGGDYDDWNTINIGTMKTLNATVAAADKAKHKGNDFGNKTLEEIYGGFYGKQVSDFSSYAGEDGLSEIRISKTVTLTKAQCEAVLADTNKGRLIEVRVLRVSPNYMNMVSDDGLPEGESAHSYSDHVKVISILTKVFDEDKLKKENTLTDIKPLSDEDYKKFCLVAIKAKADASGYISQQLKNLSCIAESFSPIWMPEFNRIAPSDIHTVTKYFGYYKNGQPVNRSSDDDVVEQEVNKAQYEAARREGLNWYAQDCGSNFATRMKGIVFDANASYTHNGNIAYKLTEAGAQYNNNLASSGFLLACFGPQNGPIGIGEDGVNIAAIGEWADKIVALKDGSTFDADTEYNGVQYHDGDEIPVRMEANAYIYAATKLEDLLQKLAFCGRAAWFVDENGKISVLMDGPVDYTKGVINAQNCISSSNAFSYEEPPAGLYISFSDENDGYQTNQFYCWSDGNSPRSYHGQVEPYSIEFVTNPYQIWSLGRYLLALREMNREVLTRKIGVEGATYNIGNVVLLQSEDLLIGDCSGRIQEVIEDENYIYGFVCNSPYEYNAEQGEGTGCSTQGVTIMQPRYYGKSNAVTLPISMPRTQTVGDKSYTLAKGTTNVVLFKEGVPKGDNDPSPTQDAKYNFKTGDICMFGLRDYISAPYRITKIKPEKDGTFTQTLIPYDEGLYNAGAQIPSFQSFMPPPVVEEAPVSLSEVPTTLKEQNDTLQTVYNAIGIINDPTPPDLPISISAVASRDFISLAWINTSDNVKHTIIELSKQNGDDGTWTQVAVIDSDNWRYNFNRTTDGYPEANSGTNKLSTWKFRLKNVSMCDVESAFTSAQSVTTTNYGTWVPATPSITLAKADRDGIDIAWSVDTNNRYGTSKYNVVVRYNDVDHAVNLNANLTARFDFNRNETRGQDAYPEASDFANWSIKVTNTNESDPTGKTATTSIIDTSKYDTWIPSNISNVKAIAEKDTITLSWDCNNDGVYGNNVFSIKKNGVVQGTSRDKSFVYYFNRNIGEYPEKSDFDTASWGFVIECTNESTTKISTNKSTSSNATYDKSRYLSWLPAVPVVSFAASGRTISLEMKKDDSYWGWARYELQISMNGSSWYSAYSGGGDVRTSEDYWKDTIDATTIINGRAFNQELPLTGQAASTGAVDTNYYYRLRAVTMTKDTSGNDKTNNSNYCSNILIVARATSVYDVVNNAVTTAKLDNNAVTGDKISADTVTARKLNVVAVNLINPIINDTPSTQTETKAVSRWTNLNAVTDSTTGFVVGQTKTPFAGITSSTFTVLPDAIYEFKFGIDGTGCVTTSGSGLYIGLNGNQTFKKYQWNATKKQWFFTSQGTNAYFISDYKTNGRKYFTSYILGSQVQTGTGTSTTTPAQNIPAPISTDNTYAIYALQLTGTDKETFVRSGNNSNVTGSWKIITPQVYERNSAVITAENVQTQNLSAITANLGDVAAGSLASATTNAGVPDPANSLVYINGKAGSEEFYIGNVSKSSASTTTDSHEFIWLHKVNNVFDFVIKITNFIVTSLQSIIKGVLRVKNALSDTDANAFLTVNPTNAADSGTPATTMRVKGAVSAEGKGSFADFEITNATNRTIATNALINSLTEGTSDPVDNDYYVAQYAGGGTTTTTYHRRPIKALFNYIKSKWTYRTEGSTTKIKININSTSSWMLCFVVTLYQGYRATKVMISGYQYGNNHWHEPEAVILGDSNNSETISVYFGYDSTNNLWVGFDGGSYTGVKISDVTNGYKAVNNYHSLFTISNVSSLTTLQTTVTARAQASHLNGIVSKIAKNWGTLDLSTLDASKWFPCTIPLGTDGWTEIECYVSLNSGTKPSWSTHSNGFTCHLHLFVMGGGWGTTSAQTFVLDRQYGFANINPCGWTQMINSSTGVLWLRGGGKYFVWNNKGAAFTIRTSDYTASSQTVSPSTSYQWNFARASQYGAIDIAVNGYNAYSIGGSYLTCSTAAGTAAKEVALSGFVLSEGATLFINFVNGSTAPNNTLNVNGTGAKDIIPDGNGTSGSTTTFSAGMYKCIFHSGCWYLINPASVDAYRAVYSQNSDSVDGYHSGYDTGASSVLIGAVRGSDRGFTSTGYWAGMSNGNLGTGDNRWWHILSMDWSGHDPNNWISQLALPTQQGGVPRYRRNNAGGTAIGSSTWHTFVTDENIASQTVSSASTATTAYKIRTSNSSPANGDIWIE